MSEVLFGQSYHLRLDPKMWAGMQPYPPLGTLYAAGYLRSRGHDVAVFDAMLADPVADWEERLERERPRFAVLYEDNFNYLSKMCLTRMRDAALEMIERARARGCTVLVCGSDASDHAEQYHAKGADFVLVGEGEATLGQVMDRLTGRSEVPVEEIQGLALPGRDGGRAVRTGIRPVMKELDALPFPAWDLVDLPRYREIWLERHGYWSLNMATTRGCPYHCNWCAKPIWGQRYNVRSPENVVAELKLLRESYGVNHIWFADDIMGLKPGWLKRFADVVEAGDTRIPFKCLSRADLLLRDGDIEALRRAGCRIVWIGAESGSQKILNAMDKGTRVEQIHEAARGLHAAGIEVGFFLQFGYPGETRADIRETFRMVRTCRPDDIGISVSYPLPGTKFYDAVESELGLKQNWVDSDDLAMMFRGPFSTPFYRRLHSVVHADFRMRQRCRELTRVLLRPATLRARHFRQALAMVYHACRLSLGLLHLEWLAHRPHEGIGPLPRRLTPEAAALPSPQTD